MLNHEQNDTITALSSARGRAGVAVMRISGPDALTVGWRRFTPRKAMKDPPPRFMILGEMLDREGKKVDEVLFVYFPAGGSFTGEPVVEFHLHGGPVVVEAALESLIEAGARPAEAGEFTRRAFLNGRLDLSQAEAVIDLIDAKSLVAARVARRRLAGALSDKVDGLRVHLAQAMALLETQIDFPEQDLGRVEPAEINGLLAETQAGLAALLAGHNRARVLAQGAVVAIAGRPNAGKSSLLNRLAGTRRALVHERAGTTRDVIEIEITPAGIPVRLFDTAGLHEADDEVERAGVDLALETIATADLVIYLVDGKVGTTPADRENVQSLSPDRRIVAWNKCDLCPPDEAFAEMANLAISATEGTGLDALTDLLVDMLGAAPGNGEALMASIRQHDLARRAQERLRAAEGIVSLGRDHELAAEELRDAARYLGSIVGETTAEDILSEIFSRFCVGK